MKRLTDFFIFFLLICTLSGCAGVKIYSDAKLSKSDRTGLRFYSVKPYLLVERNSEKDKPIKTSIVYLPDSTNPQYIVLKPGLGANELKLAFTNSSLISYGLTTDTQIPETINALAGMISKSSDAIKNLAALQNIPQEPLQDVRFELYEIEIGPNGTLLKRIKIIE